MCIRRCAGERGRSCAGTDSDHPCDKWGAETRTIYSNADGKYTTKWDKDNDVVTIFAGNTTNVGTFTVASVDDNEGHSATLTGKITTGLSEKTDVTGYIHNSNINAVNSNGVVSADGIGTQIQVDYSEQEGTFADATSRTVLFGKGTYDPSNADKLDMKFDYLTSIFKLTLDFNDPAISSTASLCMTGDNVLSTSRVNTTGKNAGSTNFKKSLSITVPSAKVENGKAEVYLALYPQTIQNVKLIATLEDGTLYDFDISKGKSAVIANGRLYSMARTGSKIGSSENLAGTGDVDNPIIVKSLSDLMLLSNNCKTKNYSIGKYFRLDSDITINGNWNPIGNKDAFFRGVFDGNGHTINGNIKVSGVLANDGAGIFGVIGAGGVVKNLTNKANIVVNSADGVLANFTGAIAGRLANNASIINCSNLGSITSSTGSVGGLVGSIYLSDKSNKDYSCVVEACCNEGDVNNVCSVSGSSSVGGIVGVIGKSAGALPSVKVTGCYTKNIALGTQNTKANYIGGIVGLIQSVTSSADVEQVIINSCWSMRLTVLNGTKGTKFGIASSVNNNNIYYTVRNCWVNDKTAFVPGNATNVKVENCKRGGDVAGEQASYSDFYKEMNTAWGSSEYEFTNNYTIQSKK